MKIPAEALRGWTECELEWKFPGDLDRLRRGAPLKEEQWLRWVLTDGMEWEAETPRRDFCEECENLPNADCGCGTLVWNDGVFGQLITAQNWKVRKGLFDDDPMSYPFDNLTVFVELAGWGRTRDAVAVGAAWLATETYPLNVVLLCHSCLFSGRVQAAEVVIAVPEIWFDLSFKGEGCCKAHLADRLAERHNELHALIPNAVVGLKDKEPAHYELVRHVKPDYFAGGCKRQALEAFLIRIVPAREVESQLVADYGLEQTGSDALRRLTRAGSRPGATAVTPVVTLETDSAGKLPQRSRKLSPDEQGEILERVKKTEPLPASLEPVLHGLSKVAGMKGLKNLLWREVVRPFRNPAPFKRYRLTIPNGILLYGPPGCGKTYITRQLAEELGFTFLEIIPSEVGSPYIHDTTLRIREVFKKAADKAPSVLFIDEFEALVPSRADLGGWQQYKSEEVNEFLAHMNGCAEKRILVVAASNEPQKIDRAVLRTGRLDKHVYVGPPDAEARTEMLGFHLAGRPVETEMNVAVIAASLTGYSASDVKFLADEAAREAMERGVPISAELIAEAKGRVPASISTLDDERYRSFGTRGV